MLEFRPLLAITSFSSFTKGSLAIKPLKKRNAIYTRKNVKENNDGSVVVLQCALNAYVSEYPCFGNRGSGIQTWIFGT